ncbi:MAG: poly(R)-hydroxyalkanoic acid synthase subunit PhaE, partial [Saprospiraceae bacterium]
EMVNQTKKITKNDSNINESINKGQPILKESLNKQNDIHSKVSEKSQKSQDNLNSNIEQTNNFFNSWFENQMTWTKSMMNENTLNQSKNGDQQDWMKSWNAFSNPSSPFMNFFSSNIYQNPWNNLINNGLGFNKNQDPLKHKMNDSFNQWSTQTKEYSNLMNKTYEDWIKQMNNVNANDSFKGMTHLHNHIGKFFELWVPMLKSINDKTFNNSTMSDLLNTEKYKEFMNSFFKFMPDGNQNIMDQMNQNFIQYMKSFSDQSGIPMNHFGNQWTNATNKMSSNPYLSMMEMFTQWRNSMNEAVSPLTKLMNTNPLIKDAQNWNELSDMMVQYQIKNSELQYMVYQKGLIVMNKLTDKVTIKLKSGESIESVVRLYQDWLMIGDETFSELFNSDTYSKLMTEVSSLQMRIKNQLDLQMEKMLSSHLPIATRTELNEVYKYIYDLKKTVHNLERTIIKLKENAPNNPELNNIY